MAERWVNLIRKDRQGNIIALCNPDEDWSPREREDAILDIETQTHRYYVTWAGKGRTEVRVVNSPNGKYLMTDMHDIPRDATAYSPKC